MGGEDFAAKEGRVERRETSEGVLTVSDVADGGVEMNGRPSGCGGGL